MKQTVREGAPHVVYAFLGRYDWQRREKWTREENTNATATEQARKRMEQAKRDADRFLAQQQQQSRDEGYGY